MLCPGVLALTVITAKQAAEEQILLLGGKSRRDAPGFCNFGCVSGFSCNYLLTLGKSKQTESQGLQIRLLTKTRDPPWLPKAAECALGGLLSCLDSKRLWD